MSKSSRSSRVVWEKRVARFRDSELTAAEFAAEIGVNVNTFNQWKWRLDKERRAGSVEPLPTFVELTPPASTAASPVELVLRDVTIRLSGGFEDDVLRRALAVVRGLA